VVVDTHVMRVARRLGLTRHEDPRKIELDLMALYPRERWCMLSHLLIWHGRRVCRARGERCADNAVCRRYHVKSPKPQRSSAKPRTRAITAPR